MATARRRAKLQGAILWTLYLFPLIISLQGNRAIADSPEAPSGSDGFWPSTSVGNDSLSSGASLQPREAGPVERRLMVKAGAGAAAIGLSLLAHLHKESVKDMFLRVRNAITQRPLSWRFYAWKLPPVHEREFPDFQAVADGLDGKRKEKVRPRLKSKANRVGDWTRTYVRVVPSPDEQLVKFLQLQPKDTEHGIVLKGHNYGNSDGYDHIAFEVYALQHLVPRHPMMFPLIKALRSPDTGNIYLISQRACCDVSQYYRASPESVNIQLATAEMVKALSVLHQSGFLHRDVKPPNYFVSQSGHVQLADFEMIWPMGVRCPSEEASHTPGFSAPEMLSATEFVPFNVKTDVYALGMAFARMFVQVRKYQRVPQRGALVKLILRMVESNPEERLDLEGVMQDAYFRGLDWERVERYEYGPAFPLAGKVMHVYNRTFGSGVHSKEGRGSSRGSARRGSTSSSFLKGRNSTQSSQSYEDTRSTNYSLTAQDTLE